MNLAEIFSYSFMTRALIAGVSISLAAALVGTILVLRKNSMIGDGLSHTAFGAFSIAVVLGLTPVYFAIPIVIIMSFLILKLSKSREINGDAAIALLSASSLAVGTLAISVSKGVNIDLNSYLFGSILSVSGGEVLISVLIAIFTLLFYILTYNRIFSITFDEDFSKSIGIRTEFYDALVSVICSIVVVLGMRLVGALLISSLIIFPTLISNTFSKSFRGVAIYSAIISVVDFMIGLLISFLLSTPTGATVVITNLVVLILVKIIFTIKK